MAIRMKIMLIKKVTKKKSINLQQSPSIMKRKKIRFIIRKKLSRTKKQKN